MSTSTSLEQESILPTSRANFFKRNLQKIVFVVTLMAVGALTYLGLRKEDADIFHLEGSRRENRDKISKEFDRCFKAFLSESKKVLDQDFDEQTRKINADYERQSNEYYKDPFLIRLFKSSPQKKPIAYSSFPMPDVAKKCVALDVYKGAIDGISSRYIERQKLLIRSEKMQDKEFRKIFNEELFGFINATVFDMMKSQKFSGNKDYYRAWLTENEKDPRRDYSQEFLDFLEKVKNDVLDRALRGAITKTHIAFGSNFVGRKGRVHTRAGRAGKLSILEHGMEKSAEIAQDKIDQNIIRSIPGNIPDKDSSVTTAPPPVSAGAEASKLSGQSKDLQKSV